MPSGDDGWISSKGQDFMVNLDTYDGKIYLMNNVAFKRTVYT